MEFPFNGHLSALAFIKIPEVEEEGFLAGFADGTKHVFRYYKSKVFLAYIVARFFTSECQIFIGLL